MSKIALLSKTLQNQIAAGEVVERPASVVKELLENALDAKSSEISLEIEKGGIQKIRVIDNGTGMDKDDLAMAFERYATSKISTVDDLFSIHSFGFRGEAVASIASVSQFTVRSKTADAEMGYECINGENVSPCSCPKGTEVLVENLFWNVPARRKFLKSENTESREIIKMVEAFALANPEISLQMKKDGKEVFHFSAESSQERAEKVLGKSISEFFLPLQFLGQDLKISGFCTHPNFHRSTRDRQFIFVNGRIVQADKSIHGAIGQSYHTLMPRGKFPAFVLFLDIAPEKVDVNVHPRKTEVRFHSPSEIFQIVKGTFLSALSGKNAEISPNTRAESQQVFAQHSQDFQKFSGNFSAQKSFSGNASFSAPSLQQNFHLPKAGNFPENSPRMHEDACPYAFCDTPKNPEISDFHIVGQVRKSFIIREESDGIRVIDQHAAHERIRYEKLLRDFRAKKITSQPLLTPAVFSVSASEKNMLLEEKETITQLGFEIEDFGGQEISVSAVPTGNSKLEIEKLFRNLLDDLDSFDPLFKEHISSFGEKMLSYTACRGAIKFGDSLTLPEMEQLLEDWEQCTHKDACAHGRPVSTFFPYKTLENECGRP